MANIRLKTHKSVSTKSKSCGKVQKSLTGVKASSKNCKVAKHNSPLTSLHANVQNLRSRKCKVSKVLDSDVKIDNVLDEKSFEVVNQNNDRTIKSSLLNGSREHALNCLTKRKVGELLNNDHTPKRQKSNLISKSSKSIKNSNSLKATSVQQNTKPDNEYEPRSSTNKTKVVKKKRLMKSPQNGKSSKVKSNESDNTNKISLDNKLSTDINVSNKTSELIKQNGPSKSTIEKISNSSEIISTDLLETSSVNSIGNDSDSLLKLTKGIISRAGRIRKKVKDNFKVMDILKSELMIEMKNKKSSKTKVPNVNNNHGGISDQNNFLETSSKDKNNKRSTRKPSETIKKRKTKTENAKVKSKNKLKPASMDEGLRVDVLKNMKNVLSTEDKATITEYEYQDEFLNNLPETEYIPPKKKQVKFKNCLKLDSKSPKLKQVTLSNGVVLTLACVECDYCHKLFSNKSTLMRHMLSHVDLRPYCCSQCPKKFRYPSCLDIHMKKCHPVIKEQVEYYTCHICDKVFLLHENLQLHLNSHVKSENNFKCLYCDKKFSYRLLLLEHEKTHNATGRFKCFLCEMTYDCRSRLAWHLKTHTKVKDFICQHCGKEFLRLNSIKRHVRVCHGGQRIQCPICFKELKGHLSEHLRLHEQERPHRCVDCGQRFTQSTQLTVHRRSHTGARPYACRICNNYFRHSNALLLHIRRHTGEKPFACAMCPLSFSQLPHMKTHMRKIHGKDNAYKCKKCNEFFKLKVELEDHSKMCKVGEKELTFEEKIQASVQEEEIEVESVMTLSKMRFLLALLLTMIASTERLKILGFNKRLVDDILEESVEAMGLKPCQDTSLTTITRLKKNIELLLNGTIPKHQMEKFKKENKSTEDLLVMLTEESSS